mgnify:CR=1 FL=1
MADSGGRYSAAVEGSRYGGACGLKVTVSTAQPHHLRRVPLGCAEARLGIAAVLSYKDEGWGFVGASAVVNGEIVSEEWFGTEALDGLQFNKAVAQSYELASAIEKAKPSATRSDASVARATR